MDASRHDGWTQQPQEETMDERYTALLLAGDIEAWWMISDGQQRNLYEESVTRAEAADAQVVSLSTDLGTAMKEWDAARGEVAKLTTALNLIDAARAKAVAEIEEVHRYLDECFVNAPDEGRAVPLIDRVVLLVSQIARDSAEVERLRAQLLEARTEYRDSEDYARMAVAANSGQDAS